LFSISGKTGGRPQDPPESPTPTMTLITRIHGKNEGGQGMGAKLAKSQCRPRNQSGSDNVRAEKATDASCDLFTV
jgi:hypothetical protein